MSKIYTAADQLIGHTPLLELTHIEKEQQLPAHILAKLEYFNPAGSVKDRIAKKMIDDAEAKGLLKEGSVIIEPTSGNTGIGLAAVAAAKGYRIIIVMPETMSVERQKLVKAYGAEVRLTPGSEGMAGAVRAAEELRDATEGAVILQQFENKANPQAHYTATGCEIWQQTGGRVDMFVAGVGTGGTLSGTGRRLKEYNPDIKIVAVEPETSPLLSRGQSGPHKLQGIGANFVPKTYDASITDSIVTIGNEEAMEMSRRTAQTEGLLVGISAGAAVAAAVRMAKTAGNEDKMIVTLLPDTGERYLSTELFDM